MCPWKLGLTKGRGESPDSTLKPEGKSLKTSESTTVQTTMDTDEVSTAESVKPSNVTKRPKTVSEVESLMQEVHSRMPAWKATKILETREASQVDLAALGEVTGILFESRDMLNKAIQCLDKLREKKTNEEDTDLDESETSDSHSSESQNADKGEDGRSNDQKQSNANAASAGDTAAVPSATGGSTCVSNQGQESSSKPSTDTSGQQGETSSKTDAACKDKQESAPESHKEWFDRVTQRGQGVLSPPEGSGRYPTLLTGVQPSDLKKIETLGWKDKLETADLEHSAYLQERHFAAHPHPLEATAWGKWLRS